LTEDYNSNLLYDQFPLQVKKTTKVKNKTWKIPPDVMYYGGVISYALYLEKFRQYVKNKKEYDEFVGSLDVPSLINEDEIVCDEHIMPAVFGNPDKFSYSIKTKRLSFVNSVKNEERIIAFPPAAVILLVMIFMQYPKEAVHYIFMSKPRHKYHDAKCSKED